MLVLLLWCFQCRVTFVLEEGHKLKRETTFATWLALLSLEFRYGSYLDSAFWDVPSVIMIICVLGRMVFNCLCCTVC